MGWCPVGPPYARVVLVEGRRRIDRITSGDYLEGVERRPLTEIREMRLEATEEADLLSYERRLLHGRLAILRAEIERRRGGGEGSLIEQLPKILSEEGRGPSRGQFPAKGPLIDFEHPKRRISKLISDDTLANLRSLSDDEVARIVAELEGVEAEVSGTRRKVLDIVDAMNAELGRRYKSGEADPSDVLTRDV